MPSFQFIHAADIHLDSPLKGLAGQEGSASERIRTAPREAFEQLVGTAIKEKVAFFVIAGDLYDGDWPDYKTGLFFASQMGRLNEAGIEVFMLYGNHDAASQITKNLTWPSNVKEFDTKQPETFKLDEYEVVLHGQGFSQRDISDNLAITYPEPVPGAFNIGVLHTGLGGRGGHKHANYAPCTLDDLVSKGYDYWALGHVHRAEILNETPYVVFPGNLQGRDIGETGAKGAYLISVMDGEVTELNPIHCDLVRWARVPVDVADAVKFADAVDCIRDALAQAVAEQADGRLLACRILLQGRTAIHEQLMIGESQLLEEARAAALGLGNEVAWIEKVVIETVPLADSEALAEREDAIGELQRVLAVAGADAELREQLETHVGEMVRHLPLEVRQRAEDDILKAVIDGDYDALIAGVMPYLTARLTAGDD